MKKLKISTVLFAMGVLISISSYAQSRIDRTFTGISEIDIGTGSSNCVVKKASGNEVNVILDHDFGDQFKPSVQKVGSKLVIKESHGNHSGRGRAVWTLTVPDGLRLNFNTGSGDFEASNLEVKLQLNAGSGDFKLENINGAINSNSGSGDLELTDFRGQIKSNVGSGDMAIDNASGQVDLNCGSGDIELSKVNASISANVGSGDVSAKTLTLAGASKFNSGSGDVWVGLAESPKSDVSVNSGSGDAELDFNGNDINATVVMTANKRNGHITAPFPFDKEEEIDNGSGDPTIQKTARLGNGGVKIKVGTGSGTARVRN